MIDVELAAWGAIRPCVVFLIQRKTPLRPEPESQWRQWCELYERVSAEERSRTRIVRVDNNCLIEGTVRQLALSLSDAQTDTADEADIQMPLDLSTVSSPRIPPPAVFSSLSPAKPTVVYDTYWRFAAERQEIFFKRWKQTAPPWTSDRILSEFKFTNAYRASDRVSQFLIKEVIYRGDQSEEELFFRTILFKLFNKIETWRLLEKAFGAITYAEFDFKSYDHVLSNASVSEAIYSGAYIMPSGSVAFGTTRKHRAHLKLLMQMMEDEVALRIAEAKTHAGGFYASAVLSDDR